jgi:hypothetical protein
MTLVALLTIEQKDQLVGQLYDEDSYFNPIQDITNSWIISTEETEQCVYEQFQWVKSLPLIEYIPQPYVSGSL